MPPQLALRLVAGRREVLLVVREVLHGHRVGVELVTRGAVRRVRCRWWRWPPEGCARACHPESLPPVTSAKARTTAATTATAVAMSTRADDLTSAAPLVLRGGCPGTSGRDPAGCWQGGRRSSAAAPTPASLARYPCGPLSGNVPGASARRVARPLAARAFAAEARRHRWFLAARRLRGRRCRRGRLRLGGRGRLGGGRRRCLGRGRGGAWVVGGGGAWVVGGGGAWVVGGAVPGWWAGAVPGWSAGAVPGWWAGAVPGRWWGGRCLGGGRRRCLGGRRGRCRGGGRRGCLGGGRQGRLGGRRGHDRRGVRRRGHDRGGRQWCLGARQRREKGVSGPRAAAVEVGADRTGSPAGREEGRRAGPRDEDGRTGCAPYAAGRAAGRRTEDQLRRRRDGQTAGVRTADGEPPAGPDRREPATSPDVSVPCWAAGTWGAATLPAAGCRVRALLQGAAVGPACSGRRPRPPRRSPAPAPATHAAGALPAPRGGPRPPAAGSDGGGHQHGQAHGGETDARAGEEEGGDEADQHRDRAAGGQCDVHGVGNRRRGPGSGLRRRIVTGRAGGLPASTA